jgi:hypothetical protein
MKKLIKILKSSLKNQFLLHCQINKLKLRNLFSKMNLKKTQRKQARRNDRYHSLNKNPKELLFRISKTTPVR